MEFATFCNICFNTDNEVEEHENVSNILIMFIANLEIIKKSKVYLCRSCWVKLQEYEKFRNMCVTNILEFRYLYYELKRKLDIADDPEIENKLRNFISEKVHHNKSENSVCEEIKTTCAAFKNDICNTMTAESDVKSDEIRNIKCEEDTVHSETDLENEIATQLETLQNYENTYDIKMEDECTAEANEGNDFEYKLHTEIDFEKELVTLELRTPQDYSNIESEGVHTVNSNKANTDADEREKLVYARARNSQSHACNVCEKTFTELSKLKIHQRLHNGTKRYTCNMCNKSFNFFQNLKQHQRIHSHDKPYACNACDKTFTQSVTLITHQRIHSGDRPYVCNVCGKSFTQSSNLKHHQRIHTGDRPYVCNVCDKAFTQSSNLSLHRRIHSGNKPYKCDVCDKAFAIFHNLKQHERIHSKEKPYVCSVCDKAFTQAVSLIAHRRVHSGDKPYQCNICDKAFTRSYCLIRHQRIHSGDKPYQCNVCNKTFSESSTLKQHQRIHV